MRDKRRNGAGGETRTPDRLITNQMLYQLSYASAVLKHKKRAGIKPAPIFGQRNIRDRSSRIKCLAMTYSHMAFATLPSALNCFTSEFEMGSGGTSLLLSPDKAVEFL